MAPAMIRHALALSAVTLLACNGCNDKNAPPANAGIPAGSGVAAAAAGETVVHAEDDGKSFAVARGGIVTLKPTSNSGTGSPWTPPQADGNPPAHPDERAAEAAPAAPG